MNRSTAMAVIAATVAVVALLVFFLYPRDVSPPDAEREEVTDIERGDSAREAIAELQQGESDGGIDYQQAFEQGRSFHEDGRLADAQLMYFFAARGGHAGAAFELGSMYDPLHYTPDTSLMDEPDPFQAFKWYSQAREGGVAAANERLTALRDWAEREAGTGNPEAEQLLLQWN